MSSPHVRLPSRRYANGVTRLLFAVANHPVCPVALALIACDCGVKEAASLCHRQPSGSSLKR